MLNLTGTCARIVMVALEVPFAARWPAGAQMSVSAITQVSTRIAVVP
jgi:hypothetical protein